MFRKHLSCQNSALALKISSCRCSLVFTSDVSVVSQLRVNEIDVVIKGRKARKAMVFGIHGVLEPVRRKCDEIRRYYSSVSHLVLMNIILIIKIMLVVIMSMIIMMRRMMMMMMVMMVTITITKYQ